MIQNYKVNVPILGYCLAYAGFCGKKFDQCPKHMQLVENTLVL